MEVGAQESRVGTGREMKQNHFLVTSQVSLQQEPKIWSSMSEILSIGVLGGDVEFLPHNPQKYSPEFRMRNLRQLNGNTLLHRKKRLFVVSLVDAKKVWGKQVNKLEV